jgi:hypothetical protein
MQMSLRFFDRDKYVNTVAVLGQGLKFRRCKAQIEEVRSTEARVSNAAFTVIYINAQCSGQAISIHWSETEALSRSGLRIRP